jgi:hypothetical protein
MNEGRQFVGSFEMRIKMLTRGWKGYALFVIKNKTSTFSGAYHRVREKKKRGPVTNHYAVLLVDRTQSV